MKIAPQIRRFRRALTYFRLCTMHTLLKPIAKLIYRRKHIWIVTERGTDARDNGLHMYRFIREQHPEINAYYIIKNDSPDYPRVAPLGNIVERGSLKHWLLYLGAEIKISTHINGFIPANNWHYFLFASHRRKNEKVVNLKHGIIKDDMRSYYRDCTNVSLFICGAKPEYDFILANYGYSEKELKYTGLARYDYLHGNAMRRQVLIMPTWRSWLSTNKDGITAEDVENSTYLKCWASILNSQRLQEMAEKYDVSFVFYPHYEVQPFLALFQDAQPCVTIADFAHFDVQELLKESMLLVTDYSSVFFDFAYMKKPVLYYQFDEAEYRAQHYAQGYFDYRKDGFGEVVTEETELLNLIEQYLLDGCTLRPEYAHRVQAFFPLNDTRNCERIFGEIVKM